MCWPDAGEALGFGLDHRAEVIPTQGALLLKVGSDGFQVVIGEGFVQQLSVGCGARFRRGGERNVFRMRRENGLLAKAAMAGGARPLIASRIIRHAGAYGVELNIAVAVQHIAFAVDQAGLVAAFPRPIRGRRELNWDNSLRPLCLVPFVCVLYRLALWRKR